MPKNFLFPLKELQVPSLGISSSFLLIKFHKMKQSTLFQSQTVNYETGEITEMTVVKASANNEKFFIGRESDGLDWLYSLSGNQIKTLVFLLSLERVPRGVNNTQETISHITVVGTADRAALCDILSCTTRYLNKVLASLESSKWIIRLSKTDYIINPKGFYKGSSKDVFKRMTEFNRVAEAEQPKTTTEENDADV